MERTITITGMKWTIGALSAGLLACHSSAQTHQLRDAREAYSDATETSATKRVPQDLHAARVALDQAEREHKVHPGSDREARLASVAQRKAELAVAHGELVEANAQAQRERSEKKQAERAEGKAEASKEPEPSQAAANPAEAERAVAPVHKEHMDKEGTAALQNLAQVANVKQEPRGIVITISGSLLFPTGKEELSPIGRENMDRVADAVAQQPAESKLLVEGYTDDTGSKSENERLSQKRAQAVAAQLVERGIDRKRIAVVGYGESRPIASNDNEEGRALNRRVEIVIAALGKEPLASN